MSTRSRLGEVIRERRNKLGLTLEEVAIKLGTTGATISNLERSRHPVTSYYYHQYNELLTRLECRQLRELSDQHPQELVKILSEKLLDKPVQTGELAST